MEWIARNKLHVSHIIITSSKTCQGQLPLFLDRCSYLGVPIASEQMCGHATTLSFKGIKLDSVSFEAWLLIDKIN